ncbi:hypothetical protein ABIF83_001205 [Bradyrhizobium ottawaense]
MPVPAMAAATARSVAAPTLTSSGPLGSTRTISPSRSNSHGATIAPDERRLPRQACVDKLARMIGPAVAIQVIWRGSGCKALNARTDWNRHHVLLQTLVVSDASITTSGQNVDKVILRNHFQPDVRISGEKGRRDGGQHEACRTDRYVQTQGTCWPVAGAVDDVDGSFHLGECWPEPLEETLTCLSGRHGSRRPVQQSDAELRFQPGYRFAES